MMNRQRIGRRSRQVFWMLLVASISFVAGQVSLAQSTAKPASLPPLDHSLETPPSPPQSLLQSSNPQNDSFTRPLQNDLRPQTPVQTNPTAASSASRRENSSTDFGAGGSLRQQNSEANGAGSSFPAISPSNQVDFPPLRTNPSTYGSSRQASTDSPLSQATPATEPIRPTRSGIQAAPQSQAGIEAPQIDRFRNQNQNPVQNDRSINRDSQIGQTSFTQPITRPKLKTSLAKSLIARYSVDSVTQPLPGEPIKLVDFLKQSGSNERRRAMVHQFWETHFDWASYLAIKRHKQWLDQVSASASQTDRMLLNSAKMVASDRVLAAEIQLGKSQSKLLQFIPNRQSGFLPLPGDLPLIQRYATGYDAFAAHQMIPDNLRGIDVVLPKMLSLISSRAQTVETAKSTAAQLQSASSQGRANLPALLEAGRIWRAAELDLIASVTSYNQAIADYSLTVERRVQSPDRVAAMLIGKPKTSIGAGSSATSIAAQPIAPRRSSPVVNNGQPGERIARNPNPNTNYLQSLNSGRPVRDGRRPLPRLDPPQQKSVIDSQPGRSNVTPPSRLGSSSGNFAPPVRSNQDFGQSFPPPAKASGPSNSGSAFPALPGNTSQGTGNRSSFRVPSFGKQ